MLQPKQVDSYRYLDRITRKLVEKWIELEEPREIPWAPLSKRIDDSTVALVSSAGLALKTDRPFDQEGERQNPWWGDPSYRILPRSAEADQIELYHLHISRNLVEQDLNTVFPLERLLELEERGEVGRTADHHYSYMGYLLQPEEFLEESVPGMVGQMRRDGVDAVVLLPG
jgi:D-proline reductase (dithiol) PrdB